MELKKLIKYKMRELLLDLSETGQYRRLYDHARENFKTHGRGAILMHLDVDNATETVLYIDANADESIFAISQKLIDQYDPQTEFVLNIAASINKKSALMTRLIHAQKLLDDADAGLV